MAATNARGRARVTARVPQRLVPAPQLQHDENADENMTDETEEVWQTEESKWQRRLRTQVRVPLKFIAPPHLPGDERADENVLMQVASGQMKRSPGVTTLSTPLNAS